MKANDTQIRIFLEGSKQFIVPLFQRTYSWKRDHIEKLWEDIEVTRYENQSSHFFGSFVTMPISSMASGVSKYTIIDGQQRLTTIFILLATLRNRIFNIDPNLQMKDEINELYLMNKFHKRDKFKVIPTQADRDLFFRVLNDLDPPLQNEHLITNCFDFFRDKLSEVDKIDDLISIKDTILSKLAIVDIKLDNDDDPYLIFESLNATGTLLTQADLVRNYLFMRVGQMQQQKVYDEIWFPMQESLKDYHLESFIRHYLAMDGDIPNFNKVYSTFKGFADTKAKCEEDVIEIMKDLLKFSHFYYNFLSPEKESKKVLRELFENLNRLEVTTSYPLLLRLYEDYVTNKLSLKEFCECLKAIETFIVRRAVCGIPTNVLNKYFPTIYKALDQSDIVVSFKNLLKNGPGARRMPNDQEFKQCLKERKLFGNRILEYVLEEIEQYNNKEVVNFEELQIEHIMPQTLNDEWKKELGEGWELIYEKYMDTLGNLTLTGYNPEYSNKLFKQKRDMEKGFRDSALQINRQLAKIERWSEKEILERAEKLSRIGLKIWAI